MVHSGHQIDRGYYWAENREVFQLFNMLWLVDFERYFPKFWEGLICVFFQMKVKRGLAWNWECLVNVRFWNLDKAWSQHGSSLGPGRLSSLRWALLPWVFVLGCVIIPNCWKQVLQEVGFWIPDGVWMFIPKVSLWDELIYGPEMRLNSYIRLKAQGCLV